jgi:hypothetical protein
MKTIELTTLTDADGIAQVPTGVPHSKANIVVTLPDAPPVDLEAARKEWRDFVKQTMGSIEDAAFRRHPQGEYQKRESFE